MGHMGMTCMHGLTAEYSKETTLYGYDWGIQRICSQRIESQVRHLIHTVQLDATSLQIHVVSSYQINPICFDSVLTWAFSLEI